jgi:hypothetical protein
MKYSDQAKELATLLRSSSSEHEKRILTEALKSVGRAEAMEAEIHHFRTAHKIMGG